MTNDNDNKPLWQKFYELSATEAAAEQQHDLRRLEAGEMSEAEACERADAWRRAGEKQLAEAAGLECRTR
jgi:hypothetical protein